MAGPVAEIIRSSVIKRVEDALGHAVGQFARSGAHDALLPPWADAVVQATIHDVMDEVING